MLEKQKDLFVDSNGTPIQDIPGLIYIADYISVANEQALLSSIDQQAWLTDLKRRVQHYGYKYDYKARGVMRDAYLGALPSWLFGLCRRLYQDKVFPIAPDQVIVNEYMPGQGISSHIDCIPCFGDTIASLSIGSGCIMAFSNPKTGRKQERLLERCSLVVLSGPARHEWMHAIPARKSDVIGRVKVARERRISLTFRKVLLAG